MWEKRKSVQKNKVFIFIAVLHLGETGSLTKLNLSKGMNFTLQCEVYMYSKTSQGLHNFFSRNAYCLVTDKRICRIEKVDWEMSGSQATDVWQY